MLKTSDLQIDRLFDGAWQIYTLLNGHIETRLYYGYSKQEAIRIYLSEFNNVEVTA